MDSERIPVGNLFFLLSYAWNQLEEAKVVNVGRGEDTAWVDLLGRVLISGVRHLMRRGLWQDYLAEKQELSAIRGRVDLVYTKRNLLHLRGRVYCETDNLSVNTRLNQIIRSTLLVLLKDPSLDRGISKDLVNLSSSLSDIATVALSKRVFRQVQIGGGNRFYRFLVNVCEFIYDHALPDSKGGQVRFRNFSQDDRAMAILFERFLFHFCKRECSDATVRRERIVWVASSQTDPDLKLLPSMNTDISVFRPGSRLIIDAKFYRQTMNIRFEAERFHSQHLYQLISYVSQASLQSGDRISGLLLYPRVDRDLNEMYKIGGHRIGIRTIDLAKSPTEIRRVLLEAVQ